MPKAPPPGAPWAPVKYSDADVLALQALQKGEAQPHQQVRALKFIVEAVCGTYDLSFRPGADGDRDTAFAEGKRFCGSQIVKFCNINPAKLRNTDGRRTGKSDRDPDRSPEQPGPGGQ